jgi:hypothetical protein
LPRCPDSFRQGTVITTTHHRRNPRLPIRKPNFDPDGSIRTVTSPPTQAHNLARVLKYTMHHHVLMTWDFPVAVYRSERAQPPFTRPLPAASCQHFSSYQTPVNFQTKNHRPTTYQGNKLNHNKLQTKILSWSVGASPIATSKQAIDSSTATEPSAETSRCPTPPCQRHAPMVDVGETHGPMPSFRSPSRVATTRTNIPLDTHPHPIKFPPPR